ncbi:DUF4365 domain-containing protein [Protofrankia sp. BMG5.30]|uniref:DUF4365 domain-containing protein n=1 Tax=Protofrankia TaxID=2994361 RepID=UPI0009F97D79
MQSEPVGGAAMPVNKNRVTKRAAIHAFTGLMERHEHMIQKIDGDNDHGEDLYVSFVENLERTGNTVWIQVKGGRSYRTGSGYHVPTENHREYWSRSNAPVFCVVHDPETDELFCTNASAQLRKSKRPGREIASVQLTKDEVLNDRQSVRSFVRHVSISPKPSGWRCASRPVHGHVAPRPAGPKKSTGSAPSSTPPARKWTSPTGSGARNRASTP